ncbi:LysM peptidoglycan-binding domain-containing protein [uncultured Tyzzerella sp.]|uniref:LysM peptidoglycan-binding domain-containing protein n=1 Tax=uncultured Tyzzerella sp. TaxID=2321398 RepID=UPI0029423A7B|nr:LysM peptidoglycan-binding domain-containing protein [uncultured Tyzzerella sp.]
MSSKDKDNIKSKQLYNEDFTKRLVKNILENDNEDEKNNNSDFNIEYEEYDNDQFDDDYDDEENYDEDDYEDDYDNYQSKKQRKSLGNINDSYKKRPKSQNNNPYRRNIEKYGKEFFDDDYDEYEDNSPSIIGRVISFSIIIVLTISTAFLALNLIYTKKELTEAKAQVQELLDTKKAEENKIMEDSLKSEISALKQENEDLKSQIGVQQPNNTEEKTQPTTKPSNISNKPENNSNTSKSTEYIVKEGDIIWNISKKVYGNGSHFQKILDANGLKENSVLKPGQKLIIPNIN